MSELSTAACAVLEAGRKGLAAPAGAREQMQAQVFTAAGVAGPAASTPASPSPVPLPLAAKLFVVGALVVGGVGIGWWSLRDTPAPPRAARVAVTAPPAVAPPPQVTPIAPPAPPAPVPAPAPAARPTRAKNRAPVPSPAAGLADELRLVSAARGALVDGNPRAALAKIATYERRFAHGELAPEAAMVRIDALCAAGRVADADAEVDRFVDRWPNSPHRRRALLGCAAAGKGTNR